jgi:hypothetical protein
VRTARRSRLKLFLSTILRKIDRSGRSIDQIVIYNELYILAKLRRFCRGLRCTLGSKKRQRSEDFDGVGILRIGPVAARSHIRLTPSTFTRYRISKATIGLPRKSTPTAEVPLREYGYNDVAEDGNIALRLFPDDIHELYQYSVEVRAMICGFCIEVSKGVVAGAEEVEMAGLVSNRMRPDLKPRKA